ncbi:hypothetical protein CNECB9_5340019 [Cupriavidus necator]|uniref:Uncharacterized protein n=1 Tax=Cupriavidus necator TaxID=106590 RepID=A0A1K0IQB8_CUPNE|nr:hypothetical protein CNECB9_5340019 [Cupriavidus necator]
MADVASALIGASAALVGGFLANFVGESYKRHLDAKAMAGALKGELSGHLRSFGVLQESLRALRDEALEGRKHLIRDTGQIASPIFESHVSKIGLLGPTLAEGVTTVYERIRAFRTGMMILSRDGEKMEAPAYARHLGQMLSLFHEGEAIREALLRDLGAAANAPFRPWK